MAHIVLADDGIPFNGRSPETGPLGGAESAVVALAEALAARGHRVEVCNRTDRALTHKGVAWRPLGGGLPARCDLYIANRGSRLIDALPGARRTVFWIHNPARYLLKWRFLGRLWRVRPAIVFSGAYHAATYPRWAPAGDRIVIPYGIDDTFRTAAPAAAAPGPRAIFTSNPRRGLDWLLDLWARAIRPRVPEAELRVFAGAATYGGSDAGRIGAAIEHARALAAAGVALHEPVPKARLVEELRAARVMLYRGDPGETFCLALAEAQALGVPAVVQPIGCVAERVVDGETGVVAADEAAFAEAAVRLLGDDALWRRMQRAALAHQRDLGWDRAAAGFEALIP